MPNDGSPTTDDEPAQRDALADALAELRDEHAVQPGEPADRYWLRVGLRLGLRQPGRAQLLLERLDGRDPSLAASAGETAAGDSDEDDGVAEAEDADVVPLRSLLLARSAALPMPEDGGIDPDTLFGWAGRLTRDEVLWIGRVVTDMLAAGARPDIARGFGISWHDGVKVHDRDANKLFKAFTELEVTVSSVLGGYDLRAVPRTPSPSPLGNMLRALLPPSDSRASEAGSILDRAGVPGQRGLVALWNAWVAMRYRQKLPEPLFTQLVQPWVTVVGRLPEP
ncbi:MAG TPA: hypothetical protein VIH37_08135 [Candidatus Limnocylindrales bacterium]